jgi:hypothetical protein
MSHATDGDLHAYLDGALASGDPVRAERLAAHLDGCSDCRVRLEEARSLRSRAGEILAEAELGPVRPPPFEEILKRAETAEGSPLHTSGHGLRSTRTSRPPLAWAASVAIALGAGWLGHAVWTGSPVSDFTAMREADPASTESPAEAPRSSIQPSDLRVSETDDGSAVQPFEESGQPGSVDRLELQERSVAADLKDLEETPPVDAAAGFGDRVANLGQLERDEAAVTPEREGARARGERQNLPVKTERPATESATEPAPSQPARAERLAVAPPQGAEADEAYRELRKQVADDSAIQRGAADPDEVTGVRRADALVSGGTPGEPDVSGEVVVVAAAEAKLVWLPVSRGDAEQWMGGRLFQIPELEITDLAISTFGGAHLARVRQSLSGGETLELIQRAISAGEGNENRAVAGRIAGADEPRFASGAGDSVVTLTLDREGFRIMATAPVAIDSLRILLSRVR